MSNLTFKNKNRVFINERNFQQYWNLYLVDEDIEIVDSFGISSKVNLNNEGFLVGIEKDRFEFTLRWIYKDRQGIVRPISQQLGFDCSLEEEVKDFLFQDKDFTTVVIGEKVYYTKPSSARIVRKSANNEYLEVTFESLAPNAFSPIIVDEIHLVQVNDLLNDSIKIGNNSLEDNYINLEVKCILGNPKLTILNRDINKSVILNLTEGSKVYVDSENVEIEGLEYTDVEGDILEVLTIQIGCSNMYDLNITEGEVIVKFIRQEVQGC